VCQDERRALDAHRVLAHAGERRELAEVGRTPCAALGGQQVVEAPKTRSASARSSPHASVIIEAEAIEIAQPEPSKRDVLESVVDELHDAARWSPQSGLCPSTCGWRRHAAGSSAAACLWSRITSW
jgi:hypothetical protein